MTQAWLAQAERGSPSALALITFIGTRLGRGSAQALLYPISLYFLLTAGEARRASRAFLRRVLAREPRWTEVFQHIHTFARTILDRVFLLTGQFKHFDITVHNSQIILDQVSRRQGALVLSAHLGSFEVLRAIGILDRDLPVKVLMNVDHNSVMTRFTNALNPQMSETIIPIHRVGTLLAVKESVDEGYLVGVLGDRVVRDDRTVTCDFLGAPAAFPAGPLQLAAALGCRVILAFGLYRGGNRYDVHFEVLSEGIPATARRTPQGVREWLQAYADRLAWYSRQAPYNWFNFFDFWADGAVADSPPKANRWAMIGSDGAVTFLLSNLLIACTGGASLIWQVVKVRRVARETPAAIDSPDVAMVLGVRLRKDEVTSEYACRLQRAAVLFGGGGNPTILVLGGRTGDASVSEAEQGRRFLVAAGVAPERLLVEDRSAHTLDNLRQARTLLQQRSERSLALITSRYHLARSHAMARGLRLQVVLCAAEDRWRDGVGPTLLLLREGYLLHWYHVGKTWSEWTGNRRSLAKIS